MGLHVMAACRFGECCGPKPLLLTPCCIHISHGLAVTLKIFPFQCATINITDISQQTIHQLQLSHQPAAASDIEVDTTRLLAVRCTCCVAVLRLLPPGQQ